MVIPRHVRPSTARRTGGARSPKSLRARLVPLGLIIPYLSVFLLLVCLPTVGLVIKSLTANNTLELEVMRPASLPGLSFTLRQFRLILETRHYRATILSTLGISFAAVGLSALVGTPVAYIITRRGFRAAPYFKWWLSVPIYMPTVVAAYGIVMFFAPFGVLNTLTQALFGTRLHLLYNTPAVLIGMFYIIVATYIRTVAAAFEVINPSLAEASVTLGASELTTFRKILVPLALPSILAATMLTLTLAMGIIAVPLIVGGGALNIRYLPLEVFLTSTTFSYNIPLASALAVILLGMVLAGQALATLVLRRKHVA